MLKALRRKTVVIIVVFFMISGPVVSSYAVAPVAVMALGEGALWAASNGPRIWPILVRVGAAVKWIAVEIGGSRMAQLIGTAALTYGALAPGVGTALQNFTNSVSGWTWNNGQPMKPGELHPGSIALTDMRAWNYFQQSRPMTGSYGSTYDYQFALYMTQADASGAATAFYNTLTSYASNNKALQSSPSGYDYIDATTHAPAAKFYQANVWYRETCEPYVSGCYRYHYRYYGFGDVANPSISQPGQQDPPLPVTVSDIQTKIAEKGVTDQNVRGLILAVEKPLKKALDEPASAEGQAIWGTSGKTVAEQFPADLANSIPQSVFDNISTTVPSDGTPWEQPIQGQTGPYTGGNSIGLSSYQPAFADFPARFNQFMTDMKQTSLFSLPGAVMSNIPASSECSMQIDLGQTFGGIQTVSFCNWSWLSILRAVVLVVFSCIAVRVIVLKGL